MRLVIADPPFLGCAERWYGRDGRGYAHGQGRPDTHPDAAAWDDPATHVRLVERLKVEADGWAVTAAQSSLPLYLAVAPQEARLAVWVRGNAIGTGSRVRQVWQPVLVRIPDGRGSRAGRRTDDALVAGRPQGGWVGRKPEVWTHWILDLLAYDPAADEVVDLFPGSGAVTQAVATYRPDRSGSRRREVPPVQAKRLRSAARGATDRRAAVLSALSAGGSVRAVAAAAKVSTHTVQRWQREAEPGAEGRVGARSSVMTPERTAAAAEMRAGGHTLDHIARVLGVGRSSVSRALAGRSSRDQQQRRRQPIPVRPQAPPAP